MKKTIFSLLILILSISKAISISPEKAEQFIHYLIHDDEKVEDFFNASDLKISNRLGIEYLDVSHKFLISYDIDKNIKDKIIKGDLTYEIISEKLVDGFSKITFSVNKIDYKREYFFKEQKLVSPILYQTKNWKQIESNNFVFIISDSTQFNSYSTQNMERFLEKMLAFLNFSEEQKQILKIQKIYYILCKDEDEIKEVTGFYARGMYNLAFDSVITTFNAYYHELMHLLINFKLGELPLYTHPFFQEGFAVTTGGRGGKEPEIILDLGVFLTKSELLDYSVMLTKKDFYKVDASFSYPLCGLYNYFLIKQIGIEKYLTIYQKFSGSASNVEEMIIKENELLARTKWNTFINDESQFSYIDFENPKVDAKLIYQDEKSEIREDLENYYFKLKDTLLIKTEKINDKFQSKKFSEIYPELQYKNEKYLILVNENEISIYNLFTNNLISNLVASFCIPFEPIPYEDGFYFFRVEKSVFDEELKEDFFGN